MGKVKTLNFSESIAASDLKVGRCRQLNELIRVKVSEKGMVISLPWPKVVYI